MRFGRQRDAAKAETAGNELRAVSAEPSMQLDAAASRELFVRYARKDGRLVAMLRAVDREGSCVVEAEVHPQDAELVRPGPYSFADAHDASAFVTEAVTALMYLGCDIQAQ